MLKNRRKRFLSSILILVVSSLLLVQAGLAADGTTQIVISAAEFFPNGIYNVCYGEGGELVTDLSGSVRILMKNSGDTTVYHVNGGVQGVGATSGVTYHIGGALQDVVVKEGESVVHNFQVVGPGAGNNFVFRYRFQIHMTANGPVITSSVDDIYCR